MFYIVLIHNLGYGGVVAAADRGSAQHLLGRYAGLGQQPLPVMLLEVLGSAAGFVLFALLADWVRQQLFRLLRVKSRVHRLADRLFRAKVNGKNCFRRFSGVKKKRRTL